MTHHAALLPTRPRCPALLAAALALVLAAAPVLRAQTPDTMTVSDGTFHLTGDLPNTTIDLGSAASLTFGQDTVQSIGGLSGSGTVLFSTHGSFQQLHAGDNNADTTFSGNFTATGDYSPAARFFKLGSGNLTLTGGSTPRVNLVVGEGTLTVSPADPATQRGVVGAGRTSANPGGTLVIAPVSSTPLAFTRIDVGTDGTVVLAGHQSTALANTLVRYNGGTTHFGAGVILGAISGTGDGILTGPSSYSAGPTPVETQTIAFGADNQDTEYQYGTLRAGNGVFAVLQKVGTGTFTFGGSLHQYVAFEIQEGTVKLRPYAHVDYLRLAGGTLTYASTFTHDSSIEVTAASTIDTPDDVTLNGSVYSRAGLTKTGAGTLTITGDNDNYNDAPGAGFTVNGGTLAVGNDAALGLSSAALVLNGGTLRATNSFTGTHATTLGASGGTFAVAAGEETLTWNAAVTGTGALTKTGAGTLILAGTNTYVGATAVSSGTLTVNGDTSSSAFTVAAGATLGGTGTVGALTLGAGALLAPGNSPGTLHAGNTTFAADGRFEFEVNDATGAAGTHWDQLAVIGSLTLAATSADPFMIELTSLSVANFDATAGYEFIFVTTTTGISGFSADRFSIDATGFTESAAGSWAVALTNSGQDLALLYTGTGGGSPIPEPSTYAALAGLLVLGLALCRRRRARIAIYRSTHS